MRYGLIAYATSEPYLQMTRKLADSARAYGFPIKIRFPAHLWNCSWADAVCWKPQFILDELCDTSLDGLIYTDADSVVKRRPPFLDLDGVDIGFVNWQWSPGHPVENLTGTMFFRRTPTVITFLEAWVAGTEKFRASFTPEQDSLGELLAQVGHVEALRFKRLHPSWCWIHDAPKEKLDGLEPVFEHFQASRTHRTRGTLA